MFADLAARAVFVCATPLCFAPKQFFFHNICIFFWQSMGTQNSKITPFCLFFYGTKNPFTGKVADMVARAFFEYAISLLLAPKQPF
jgi:hypothetical protein